MLSHTFRALRDELVHHEPARAAAEIEAWLDDPREVLHRNLLGMEADPRTGTVLVWSDADPHRQERVSPEVVRAELLTVVATLELQRRGTRVLDGAQERGLRAAGVDVRTVRDVLQGRA